MDICFCLLGMYLGMELLDHIGNFTSVVNFLAGELLYDFLKLKDNHFFQILLLCHSLAKDLTALIFPIRQNLLSLKFKVFYQLDPIWTINHYSQT